MTSPTRPENDTQKPRGRPRTDGAFIHDPAIDFAARYTLTQRLDMHVTTPAPAAQQLKETTP
ncbi:hypothetical protein ACM01_15025 [Streptomyces viridochromogenes]|uniref:Uncharacterized protein n=1 Tax=Streptomyces viridochromogenes TaxID=1938 RepID=A0A0J7ZFP9_STRVR|nr:hypothetical protein [Streptomyces viridochromogenes]KMS74227.1 hypothetical protein ACM01_15025 [Streptomyces viridochromogenes]